MMRRRVGGINDINTTRQLKRSRIEVDHLGFRLPDHGQQQYHLGVPVPPRAPEPYKIAAASSSMTRAHRRSSFVILAESRQKTSRSVGGSPAHECTTHSSISPNRLIYGRSSPFRPRGFKGPPPHAQSRPPSPPPLIQRRFIRPKSLSQGNSPRKQSSIPQLRGGLTGKTVKNTNSDRNGWDRGSSKRVTTRIPRSSSLRVSIANRAVEPTTRGTTKPLVKSAKANCNKTKVFTPVEKKLNRSPTKIPIRHTPSGRFIQVANVQTEKKEGEMAASKLPINLTPLPSIPVTDESPKIADVTTTSSENDSKASELIDDDPGLVDLLKQSSGGSGTSSVVNATTTTAVQPLRIETVTILPQDPAKIHSIKEEEDSILRNNTSEMKIEASVNQRVARNPAQKKQHNSESIQTIEPTLASMNVEAIIETVKNANMTETKEVESKKNGKEGKKVEMEMVIEKKAVPLKPNEKSEKSRINPSSSDTSMTHPSIEKHISIQPNVSSESPSIETQHKLPNHGSEISLKSSNGLSMGSVESIRSTDTGVSLNTVRGVSSAREKRGTHVVKRTQDIETLSGNVMNLENRYNGEPAIVEVTEQTMGVDQSSMNKQPKSKNERFTNWRNSFLKRFRDRWSRTYENRGVTIFSWQKKAEKNTHDVQQPSRQLQQPTPTSSTPTPNAFARIKAACCRTTRWRSKIAPAEQTSCCRAERSCGLLCRSTRNWCRWPSCCCSCQHEPKRNRSIRAKHSLTSVAPSPLSEEQKSKMPDVLIEHNSVMRGAIPCLPVPLAWFCLIWNVLIPGSGTLWSGLYNLCIGQPRFSATASAKSRFGALIINIIVGTSQFFTVLFCLVGWGWSIWWGVTMVRLARKWKRFKAAEASNSDLEARGNEGILPAPGVPTQTLRGMERVR